tara:strand:+ start:232 stop:405 length:174 start_codon:yes stop_codon:yes gene_type:complete
MYQEKKINFKIFKTISQKRSKRMICLNKKYVQSCFFGFFDFSSFLVFFVFKYKLKSL